MGKGDKPRPVGDKAEWDKNFEEIFGKKEIESWNPDEDWDEDWDEDREWNDNPDDWNEDD